MKPHRLMKAISLILPMVCLSTSVLAADPIDYRDYPLVRNPLGVAQLHSVQAVKKAGHTPSSIVKSGYIPGQYTWTFVYKYNGEFEGQPAECGIALSVAHTGLLPASVILDSCDPVLVDSLGELLTSLTPEAQRMTRGLTLLDERFGLESVYYFTLMNIDSESYIETYFYKTKGNCSGNLFNHPENPSFEETCK